MPFVNMGVPICGTDGSIVWLEQVRHNIAVAEYYRDGCTNPQKLLDVLAQVKVCFCSLTLCMSESLAVCAFSQTFSFPVKLSMFATKAAMYIPYTKTLHSNSTESESCVLVFILAMALRCNLALILLSLVVVIYFSDTEHITRCLLVGMEFWPTLLSVCK